MVLQKSFLGALYSLLFGVSLDSVLKTELKPIMVYFYKLWLGRRVVSLALTQHLLISTYKMYIYMHLHKDDLYPIQFILYKTRNELSDWKYCQDFSRFQDICFQYLWHQFLWENLLDILPLNFVINSYWRCLMVANGAISTSYWYKGLCSAHVS